jgi:hypothetical protein
VLRHWINCFCFIECSDDLAHRFDPPSLKYFILQPLKSSIASTKALNGAFVYERSPQKIEGLPGRFKQANWQFLVQFATSGHRSKILVSRAVQRASKGGFRPDTRDATGWYLVWRDGVQFPHRIVTTTMTDATSAQTSHETSNVGRSNSNQPTDH